MTEVDSQAHAAQLPALLRDLVSSLWLKLDRPALPLQTGQARSPAVALTWPLSPGTANGVQGSTSSVQITAQQGSTQQRDEDRWRATGRRKLEEFKAQRALLAARQQQCTADTCLSTREATCNHGFAASQPALDAQHTQHSATQPHPPQLKLPLPPSQCTCCAHCTVHRHTRSLPPSGAGSGSILDTALQPPSASGTRLPEPLRQLLRGAPSSGQSSPGWGAQQEDPVIALLRPHVLAASRSLSRASAEESARNSPAPTPAPTPVAHSHADLAYKLPDSIQGQQQGHGRGHTASLVSKAAQADLIPAVSADTTAVVQTTGGPGVQGAGEQGSAPAEPSDASATLVQLLLDQVKTLMHEKSELQREMTALALENNALQELVGYLVENQREDDELCHASDEE